MTQIFRQPSPTCPHCDHVMNDDEMMSYADDEDLFALAPNEERVCVTCPACEREYWIEGGYTPHYTTALCEDGLD